MKKAFVFLMMPGAALAHTGHDAAVVQGDMHWITQGDHLLVVAAAGIIFSIVAVSVIGQMRKHLVRG